MNEQIEKKPLTSKQRAYLMSLASAISPELQVGKNGSSPETVESLEELFHNRELVKGNVLKNCPETPMEVADALSSRTHSILVKVIGRKFIVYRKDKDDPKIVLPR